jgi:AraC family transcriptional regulator
MIQVNEHRYSPGLRQARHSHADASVTMLLAGSIVERVGESEEIARPLSIVVKPADTEHADLFGPDGAHTIQILLPPDCADEVSRSASSNRSWRWIHTGPAASAFMSLVRELRSSDGRESICLHDAAVSAIAAVADGADPCGSTPPRWIAMVRENLDDVGGAHSVSALAAGAQVHPVYLARQFRRWYGCSITDYVRRRRVQLAARHITTSRGALSTVAYDAGFSDQAHMCRVFKAETGLTPGSFRALLVPKVPTVQFAREARR